jgi:hypothetical protein
MEHEQTKYITTCDNLIHILNFYQNELKLYREENERLQKEVEILKQKEKPTKDREEKPTKKRPNRTLDCFENNAKIQHSYKNRVWECYVDKSNPTPILRVNADETYTSLSGFAVKHIETLRSQNIAHGNTSPTANGWSGCEVEIDGKWVSCHDISKKYKQSL